MCEVNDPHVNYIPVKYTVFYVSQVKCHVNDLQFKPEFNYPQVKYQISDVQVKYQVNDPQVKPSH